MKINVDLTSCSDFLFENVTNAIPFQSTHTIKIVRIKGCYKKFNWKKLKYDVVNYDYLVCTSHYINDFSSIDFLEKDTRKEVIKKAKDAFGKQIYPSAIRYAIYEESYFLENQNKFLVSVIDTETFGLAVNVINCTTFMRIDIYISGHKRHFSYYYNNIADFEKNLAFLKEVQRLILEKNKLILEENKNINVQKNTEFLNNL